MTGLYILQGKNAVPEPDVGKWGRWLKTARRTVVAEDKAGAAIVSTVFKAIDLQSDPRGKPLLFETLISGGPSDGLYERYTTWEEAEAGHARWVHKLKSAIGRSRRITVRGSE